MDITEFTKDPFDGDREVLPWIDPEKVTGIDYSASRVFYKKLLHDLRFGSLSYEQDDPECDAKRLFDYVYNCVSWWSYFKDTGENIPEELSEITALVVVKASIFFIRRLGYCTAGGILATTAMLHSDAKMNKEIFVLYKAAFEEEDDPHLKFCLQSNFLEFFGYVPISDDGLDMNWGGLSEEEITYIKYSHYHRLRSC